MVEQDAIGDRASAYANAFDSVGVEFLKGWLLDVNHGEHWDKCTEIWFGSVEEFEWCDRVSSICVKCWQHI